MEQGKNKNGTIALLVVIIVILLALVVLLVTGTISFKSSETGVENQVTDTTDNVSKELYYYKLGDDLNTEFKIYQIGNVYIATSTMQGKQCNTSDTLIFNSEGRKLKEYKYAYVQFDNDIINISYSTDGVCLSSSENMISVSYQVVGSNIVEK